MKRVLVTGATGFIGVPATSWLLKRGYEVHALGRARPLDENINFYRCNVLRWGSRRYRRSQNSGNPSAPPCVGRDAGALLGGSRKYRLGERKPAPGARFRRSRWKTSGLRRDLRGIPMGRAALFRNENALRTGDPLWHGEGHAASSGRGLQLIRRLVGRLGPHILSVWPG